MKLVLSMLVTWHSKISFHLLPIWLQTLAATNSESCQTSFPRFCSPPPEVAVLFGLNLSRCPFLGQFVNLDLLLCTVFNLELEDLFLRPILTQTPINYRNIEWTDKRCFGQQQLLANSISHTTSRLIVRQPAGARTLTQTWTLPPGQQDVKVLSAPKSQNNLCWVSILF